MKYYFILFFNLYLFVIINDINFRCKFGIIHVDFKDKERKRTRKLSTKFLQDMLKQRCIPNADYSA